MATLDELHDALRNADKAGDVSAARQLADAIYSMQSTPQQPAEKVSSLESVKRGMMDPIEGGAQLLTHILPDSVVNAGNRLNNWIADKTGLLDKIPEGGIDQQIKEQEQAYQQKRQAAGDTGVDWWRMAGNVASPANLAVGAVGAPAKAAQLGGKMLAGAATGATMSALNPVTEGDYWTGKGKQAAVGGVAGAAVPAIAHGASRVIQPHTNPDVKALMKEGITPTPGQILGGAYKKTEEKMTSLPVVGDAISNSYKRGLEQFNTAAYNKALRPVGEKLPKGIKPGFEAISHVDDILSNKYNTLLPKLKGKLDTGFKGEISTIQQMSKSMPPAQAETLKRIVDNDVLAKFTKPGLATGETLKAIESELGRKASGYYRSQSFDDRELAGAVRELQESLRRMITRNNPQHRGELSKINSAYAQFKRVERAMTYTGKDGELFTPSQLNAAVKALDKSKDKRLFSQGKALGQDFSHAAKTVLADKYPDSGTAGRMLTNGLAVGGGYMLHPGTLAAAGAGTLPYLPGFQNLAATLLAKRPGFAAPVANAVEKYAPLLTAGVVPPSYGLLRTGD